MLITQKCQYAIKAILELARHEPKRPVKIALIAEQQGIPYRFLEVILSQLKQGGFVDSRRGNEGGYLLACPAKQISVGRIVRFVDGPIFAEEEAPRRRGAKAEARHDLLSPVWQRAQDAVYEVFDGTTIADLLAEDEAQRARLAPNYVI
jgi:Rrf2 family transcriptional regulator, cysteine metabolism repressor